MGKVDKKDSGIAKFAKGDEVRFLATGEFGIVTAVDEINHFYAVEINGIEYLLEEKEVN